MPDVPPAMRTDLPEKKGAAQLVVSVSGFVIIAPQGYRTNWSTKSAPSPTAA